MKTLLKFSYITFLTMSVFSCSKKVQEIIPSQTQDLTTQDTKQTRAGLSSHYALERAIGGTHRIYKYANNTSLLSTYQFVGTLLKFNSATTSPSIALPNVSGIAHKGGNGYCLSRPGLGANWELWGFSYTNLNGIGGGAKLLGTLNGTASKQLSDIDVNGVTVGGFQLVALDRTANTIIRINLTGVWIPIAGSNFNFGGGGAIPNVIGLSAVTNFDQQVLLGSVGSLGGNVHLVKCSAGVPINNAASSLFSATIPSSLPLNTDGGTLLDPAGVFIVGGGAAANNWSLGTSASLPASGLATQFISTAGGASGAGPSVFFLDFAPM